MMITLLLAATMALDTPRADAQPACTARQPHTPAGKIHHAAAMTCAQIRKTPVRESRVVTPRKKV